MKYNELLFEVFEYQCDNTDLKDDKKIPNWVKACGIGALITAFMGFGKLIIKNKKAFEKELQRLKNNAELAKQDAKMTGIDELSDYSQEYFEVCLKYNEGILKLKKDVNKGIFKPSDLKDRVKDLYKQIDDIERANSKMISIFKKYKDYIGFSDNDLDMLEKGMADEKEECKKELDKLNEKISKVKNIKLSVHEACHSGEITAEERDLLLSTIEE